jgi:hypothetical protein
VVFWARPVIEELKDPTPVPSKVLALLTVGPGFTLQHTPLAETGLPPSLVILPPENASVNLILDAAIVVNTGTDGVLNVTSLP